MAAKRHFGGGREPAQPIVAIFRDEESCLGQVVFGRDGLQCLVIQKASHPHYRGGISREPVGGEGVNLEYRNAHGKAPQTDDSSSPRLPLWNGLTILHGRRRAWRYWLGWDESARPPGRLFYLPWLGSSTAATACGLTEATLSSARAGPSGWRLPCSQFWRVDTLTPIIRANSDCDLSSLARIAFTSSAFTSNLRTGSCSPRLIRPASFTLARSC